MTEDKDRFGDLLAKKKKGDEDQYVAEQDRLRLEKLRAQKESTAAARDRCPRCGESLVPEVREGFEVATCAQCRGVWIDATTLESMLERAGESEFAKVFRSFLR